MPSESDYRGLAGNTVFGIPFPRPCSSRNEKQLPGYPSPAPFRLVIQNACCSVSLVSAFPAPQPLQTFMFGFESQQTNSCCRLCLPLGARPHSRLVPAASEAAITPWGVILGLNGWVEVSEMPLPGHNGS